MQKITPHFTFEELTTTNNTAFLQYNRKSAGIITEHIYKLALFAEQVRAIIGVPMTITSGFRCPELNDDIGGSPTSQHTKAEAIDFIPGKGMTIDEAFDIIRHSKLVYGQLIKERSGSSIWIHISMGYKQQALTYVNGTYTAL